MVDLKKSIYNAFISFYDQNVPTLIYRSLINIILNI